MRSRKKIPQNCCSLHASKPSKRILKMLLSTGACSDPPTTTKKKKPQTFPGSVFAENCDNVH
jgi:hypothetical protein